MWKKNKKALIIAGILTLLPILIGLYYWDRLPDPMAIHFSFNGTPDGYGSKPLAVFGLPVLLLALEALGIFAISYDPKKKNISPKISSFIIWLIPAISLVVSFLMYSCNLGYKTDITKYCGLLIGILLIVSGNYLPKARQNYTVGIRIPWTLANEENWNRTHRLGGYLFVIGGFLITILSLLGKLSFPAFIIIVLVITLVPILYSWHLHSAKNL